MNIIALISRSNLSEGCDFLPNSGAGWMEMTEFHSTVKGLVARLREGVCKPSILLLYADSPETLHVLVEVAEILSGFDIVLVLGPADEYSVTLAHRLRPRVLLSVENAGEYIQAVVEKMLASTEKASCCVGSRNGDASAGCPP